MTLKAAGIAARDALAEVLGNLGLSYRVTETGTLFITTAARLAEDAGKKGAAIEGPPIKLTLSQPLKPANPSYRELTRDAYTRRLAGQGLREDTVQTLLEQYGQALFEPGELIVLAHLSREAIDEAVLLDVFPPPRKLSARRCWSSTASTLACRTAPGRSCNSSATPPPRPARRRRHGSSSWGPSPSRSWRTP